MANRFLLDLVTIKFVSLFGALGSGEQAFNDFQGYVDIKSLLFICFLQGISFQT